MMVGSLSIENKICKEILERNRAWCQSRGRIFPLWTVVYDPDFVRVVL